MKQEILVTCDGSHTLRHESLGELYHSDRGAIGEACHVYLGAGFDYVVGGGDCREVRVLEIGFGTGLNCWLTMERAKELGVRVEYHGIEAYPVSMDVARSLNYTSDEAFLRLHESAWDIEQRFDDFSLVKHRGDIATFDFGVCGEVDLVYFDAFSPDVQPELWTVEVFERVASTMRRGGVLVTYTAKGVVKANMRSVGFEVSRLEGALGKRHMVRGVLL